MKLHVRSGLPQSLEHFRRPCAGVLFAYVRAVDEKDIRLFSAGGKRQQNRRERKERCRDGYCRFISNPMLLSLLSHE